MADKNDVSYGLDYGIDFKARRLYFGVPWIYGEDTSGEFNQASIEMIVRGMHKMASDGPGKPIEIHMNSYGGDVYSMLRLYDEIQACPCQVKFYGGGALMSAATWIMSACDERYIHAHTTIMIHELAEDAGYLKHTDIQVNAGEASRVMEMLCEIYAANSRMPKEFWQDVTQRDLYLSASEAIKLGLADKVIEPKKRGNLRKIRQSQLKKPLEQGEMDTLMTDIYTRIGRKNIPTVKLNKPVKEESDPNITIDTATSTDETPLDE